MMKERTILLFFVMLLLSSCLTSKKNDTDCIENRDPDCVCVALYDPVCGCNNVTYSNACEATCAGIRNFEQGACPD